MPWAQTGPDEVQDQHKPILTTKEAAQIQIAHSNSIDSTVLRALGAVTCPGQGIVKEAHHVFTTITLRKITALSY